MSLKQRCINTAATVAVRAMAYFHRHYGPIKDLANRRGIREIPLRDVASRPLLLLVNFDWSLEPARPVSPSVKYVGALMPRAPQQLPDDILTWLEDGACGGGSLVGQW